MFGLSNIAKRRLTINDKRLNELFQFAPTGLILNLIILKTECTYGAKKPRNIYSYSAVSLIDFKTNLSYKNRATTAPKAIPEYSIQILDGS